MANPLESAQSGQVNRSGPQERLFVRNEVLRYRDILSHAQLSQDQHASVRTRSPLPGTDPRALFRLARSISAQLRTQGDALIPADAEYLRSSLVDFPHEERPFRTDTPLRDPRVADIDFRYGGGVLLESLTEADGLQELTRIARGENIGRADMVDRTAPMQNVLQLIVDRVSSEEGFARTRDIFDERARRYHEAMEPRGREMRMDDQRIEQAAMTDILTVLGRIEHIETTEHLLLVARYALEQRIPWLQTASVHALCAAMELNRRSIRADDQHRQAYLLAFNELRRDLRDPQLAEELARSIDEVRHSV